MLQVFPLGSVVNPVRPPSKALMKQVGEDPLVNDWLIATSEIPQTRAVYVEHLARFLGWCDWTPAQLLAVKKAALKEGEPFSDVERHLREYHEALRLQGYAGKSRSKLIAAVYSFIQSRGYMIPRKLLRLDQADKLEMRVPTRQEVELFVQYAHGLNKKLTYTMMTDSPCRPRVFPAIRWNWLEPEWWTKDVIHVNLPKQFRPATHGGPKKFEPICFFGPKTIDLLKQLRDSKIKAGKIPLETDRILHIHQDAMIAATRRDYKQLVALGLLRQSRIDEKNQPTEQPLTPKSWRKYQFNIIDSLTDISPEYRKMLKGRDLDTERYYSKQNVEKLREIYQTKIYPQLWTDTAVASPEEVEELREQVSQQGLQIETLETLVKELAHKAGIP